MEVTMIPSMRELAAKEVSLAGTLCLLSKQIREGKRGTLKEGMKVLLVDPMVVATKLLARTQYKDTGKQFKVIAASWIQFMIHDWIDHMENTNQQVELIAPKQVANKCPLSSFKFYPTKQFPTGFYDIKTGAKNIQDGLLQHDDDGIPISGDIRNSWAGVSALQALFIEEHNAVCEVLKKEHPNLNDEELYRHKRLVTSAVIAKIHTIDWTVELLKTDMLLAGMRANWYGLLGKKFKDTFGHVGDATLGAYIGFTSFYLTTSTSGTPMSLLDLTKLHHSSRSKPSKILFSDLIGEKTLSQIGFTRQFVSMGHQACGGLELWNYPAWLRDLVPHDVDGKERRNHVDLAALEIYRDRERKVARYNQFRRALLLIPISKWEDLTDDKEVIEVLKEVYGDDVEQLDIMVGLMAEKKIKGFAISETAFIVFLLMASRRLEADSNIDTDGSVSIQGHSVSLAIGLEYQFDISTVGSIDIQGGALEELLLQVDTCSDFWSRVHHRLYMDERSGHNQDGRHESGASLVDDLGDEYVPDTELRSLMMDDDPVATDQWLRETLRTLCQLDLTTEGVLESLSMSAHKANRGGGWSRQRRRSLATASVEVTPDLPQRLAPSIQRGRGFREVVVMHPISMEGVQPDLEPVLRPE
ncbi:Alpha-dioxygenase 1 [Hibiscus syriacus]|uniref:Alpha-dioxygenase 1 n=1 Tax=Hibiscus syriacus TaxID=106335 RepID=A0A6A2Y2D5_HIBSY|nr:Alpha-dioxygenase 1 [Hibiscus syriacus]